LLLCLAPALLHAVPVTFDIPAQSLPAAIKRFIQQSDRPVLFNPEEVKATKSKSITGRIEPNLALAQLLEGTGFAATENPDGDFTITRAAAESPKPGVANGSIQDKAGAPLSRASDVLSGADASDLKPAKVEEIVVMSPFVAATTGDVGYLAQNSVSGSRMSTPMHDVATPTTAFTQQFLEDIASTSVDDLRKYMVSTEIVYPEATENVRANDSAPARIRGLPAVNNSINFFQIPVGDATLRLDHYNTERVDLSRGPNSILFGLGSPGGIINVSTKRAILNKNLGSLTLMANDTDGLRMAIDANLALIPLKVSLRLAAVRDDKEGWRYNEWDNQRRDYATLRWQVTPKTTFDIEGEHGKVDKLNAYTYTAQDNYTPWLLAGRNLTATGATDVPRGIRRLATAVYPILDTTTGQVWNVINKGAGNFGRIENITLSLQDFSILPREVTLYGSGFEQKTKYTRASAFLTHSFTPNLNVEFAANQTGTSRDGVLPAGYSFLNVDPNTTLPNGAPNPNAGRAYVEGSPVTTTTYNNDQSLRLSGSYERDLGGWFGHHKLAVVGETNKSRFTQWQLRQIMIDNPNNLANFVTGPNILNYRTYLDLAGPPQNIVAANWRKFDVSRVTDTATGRVFGMEFVNYTAGGSKINRSELDSGMAVFQSYFLKDRLVTVFGLRKDWQTSWYSPTAQRDPNPRFAQFAQGPFLTAPGTTPTENNANNRTFSALFHVTKWLGVTYNQAANFSLPNPGAALPSATGRAPNPQGESRDIGLKLNLGRRIYFNALYFQTSAEHDFAGGAGAHTYFNPIWAALFARGVITAAENSANQTQTNGNTFDSTSKGYELELIGNITKQWRIMANYSDSVLKRANIGRESRAYIAAHRDRWMQGDNGRILLDGTGRLAAVADDGDATIETVAEAMKETDFLVFDLFTLPDGERPRGQLQRKFNLRSTYALATEGFLRDVAVGGGMRYQSAPVTNYIIEGSPATGATSRRAMYGISNVLFDFNISKRCRAAWLGRNIRWSVQLNINNLLNEDKILPMRVSSLGETINYRLQDPREFIVTTKFDF
jgi:iron complex outermembrane recepter protein